MTNIKPPKLKGPHKDDFEHALAHLSQLGVAFIKLCDTRYTNIVITKPVFEAFYQNYVDAFEKMSELMRRLAIGISGRQKERVEQHRQIKNKLQGIIEKDDPVIDEAKKVIAVVNKLISESHHLDQLTTLETHLHGQLNAFSENKMTVEALQTTCQHGLMNYLDNVDDKCVNLMKIEFMDARKNQYLDILLLIDSAGLNQDVHHHTTLKERVLNLQNNTEKLDEHRPSFK